MTSQIPGPRLGVLFLSHSFVHSNSFWF